ncbi:E3 ubiquitin-protein ligase HERC2 [Larimichthys crocea]|uniref:E3 ubiquitin-protein ligase HERC2 n=1 Tax=Larimichthys crocea TaxID=215358 RepID=A0A6G0ILZ3_LARCR|nr:E3 ubiquitin-protein ligase HERC2 [Larimichthys crocea]
MTLMQERGTFGNELDETASQPASPPTSQPARFSLDECCVGLKPDKMGANILEPTNIVIARCTPQVPAQPLLFPTALSCVGEKELNPPSSSPAHSHRAEENATEEKEESERWRKKKCGRNTKGMEKENRRGDGGNVFSWGMGQEGQLGLGEDSIHSSTPRLLSYSQLTEVTRIQAGDSYSAAVTAGGELFLWGQIPCVSRVSEHPGLKRLWTPQPVPLASGKGAERRTENVLTQKPKLPSATMSAIPYRQREKTQCKTLCGFNTSCFKVRGDQKALRSMGKMTKVRAQWKKKDQTKMREMERCPIQHLPSPGLQWA